MTRKQTFTALIIAAAALTNVNAAHATSWDMSWFTFGYSAGGIVLNGTDLTGVNPDFDFVASTRGFRITSIKAPAPSGPIPIPYPLTGITAR